MVMIMMIINKATDRIRVTRTATPLDQPIKKHNEDIIQHVKRQIKIDT